MSMPVCFLLMLIQHFRSILAEFHVSFDRHLVFQQEGAASDFYRPHYWWGLPSRQGRVELDPTLQQPFYAVPSEGQRPRLVCQMILQDVVVLKLGNFAATQAASTDPNATPSPAQAQQAQPGYCDIDGEPPGFNLLELFCL